MRPSTLHLLRRLSVLALVVAVLLAAGPPALRSLGLLGPSVEEDVESAARALEVARSYGGGPEDETFESAVAQLARARELAPRGERLAAKRAAATALERAKEAQRAALVGRDQTRRRAQAIVDELAAGLDRLETLYVKAAAGLDEPTAARLLSLKKDAREVSARLFLAFESGNYARVVAGEAEAREALARTTSALQVAAAGRPRPTAAPRP